MSTRAQTSTDLDEVWMEDVGFAPHKVTIMEMVPRKRMLYLRWRERGEQAGTKARNWRYESLGRTLYDGERRLAGRALNDVKRWAREKAKAKHHQLVTGLTSAEIEPARPLAIRETWAKVSDAKTGKYPVKTPHRKEVQRALEDAVRAWGGDTLWIDIKKSQLMALGRMRIDELLRAKLGGAHNIGDGYRGAEVTLTRVVTVAQWLRDNELIPADVAVPTKRWKDELRTYWAQAKGVQRAPEVNRQRVTLEQLREVLKVAPRVDARFALLVRIGIGLRPGQVVRVKRSMVDLGKGKHGGYRVHSYGKKKGVYRNLTAGMRAALDLAFGPRGYLREFEDRYQLDGTDYYLFPAGQLQGGKVQRRREREGDTAEPPQQAKRAHPLATIRNQETERPIGRTALRQWFKAARDLAGIPKVRGLGLYSLKRAIVDGAKAAKISREGLQEIGGWTDTQMADQVYADEEKEYARDEATDVIATILGEEPVRNA